MGSVVTREFLTSKGKFTYRSPAAKLSGDLLYPTSGELFDRHFVPDETMVVPACTTDATASLKKHNRFVLVTQRLNKARYCNKFLEAINEKVRVGTLVMGCVETSAMRKQRILRGGVFPFNKIQYTFDFIFHRMLPKLSSVTARLYYAITKGRQRVFPKAEILGRLYACGFVIREIMEDSGLLFFVAEKKQCPYYNSRPSYWPVFRMRRVGKAGKPIYVFKLRSMHAYAEYLQGYMVQNNGLAKGGKFKNDFRVTTWGRWLRRLWIDEIPMVVNLLRGDLKLIGVRPISRQYFMLYKEELRDLRIRHKPGLLPPFYADLPQSLEEIMESEKKYILEYERQPLQTDFRYLKKILYNIVVRKAKSQ